MKLLFLWKEHVFRVNYYFQKIRFNDRTNKYSSSSHTTQLSVSDRLFIFDIFDVFDAFNEISTSDTHAFVSTCMRYLAQILTFRNAFWTCTNVQFQGARFSKKTEHQIVPVNLLPSDTNGIRLKKKR